MRLQNQVNVFNEEFSQQMLLGEESEAGSVSGLCSHYGGGKHHRQVAGCHLVHVTMLHHPSGIPEMSSD